MRERRLGFLTQLDELIHEVSFLVFCSCNTSNPDHINLTFINSDVCSTVEILGPLGKKSQIRALQYPHSSQKCICLAVNDHVMLYDVTKKKIRQDFQKIPNVTCLTLSQTDKYIAAGNSNGYLYLLNPLTGRPAFTHPIRISGDYYILTFKISIGFYGLF